MIEEGRFDLGTTTRFQITNKMRPTQIMMYFGESSMQCISGFPRTLLSEPPDSAKQAALRGTLGSTRYTHGSRRLSRTVGGWQAPDIQVAKKLSNLHLYRVRQSVIGEDEEPDAEATLPRPPDAPSQPVLQAPRPPSNPKAERRVLGVRDAFRALWFPQRARKAELPPDLQQWLDTYRQVQAILPEAGKPEIPDEQLAASLQYYNVRPEEYAMYRQWVQMLQPDASTAPWLPPVHQGGREYAQSASHAVASEMHGDSQFPQELHGTSAVPAPHSETNGEGGVIVQELADNSWLALKGYSD